MNKSSAVLVTTLGLLFILGAFLLRFALVPALKVFPDDVDVIRDFDVEFVTVLDPETLEFFEAEPGEAGNITIRRHVSVVDTDGDAMLVREEQTLLNGEEPLQPMLTFHYPLHRQDLVQVEEVPEQWQDTPGLWEREGFVLAWEIDTQPQDYTGWNEDTRLPVELVYIGEDMVQDTPAYFYTSSSQPELIDPHQVEVLGLLPELTIAQVAQLASGLEVENEAMGAIIERALPTLMEQAVRETQGISDDVPTEDLRVPVDFYYNYDGQYWIEPETGSLLDTIKYEHRAATFPDEILEHLGDSVETLGLERETITDLLPVTVSEFRYVGSESAVTGAITDAEEAIDEIERFETALPVMLAFAGFAMMLWGGFVLLR